MSVQTTFNRYFTGPKPGFDSDQGRGYFREGTNKTGAELDVGLCVAQHSTIDSGIVALAASTDPVVGVTFNDQARNPNGAVNGGYPDGKMVPLKCEGAIFVQCDQDMKPGDPVFVRYATGGTGTGPSAGVVGSVRKDADTSRARKLKGARVLSSGTAASGCVEIYFSAAAESP